MACGFGGGGGGGRKANERTAAQENYNRLSPTFEEGCEVRMLIVANNYEKTECPLTCSKDGKNIEGLARSCGVSDVTKVYNAECTLPNVMAKLREIGSRCTKDDFFVFYYSGHGAEVADKDDDEGEGEGGCDEAYIMINEQGQWEWPDAKGPGTFLIDDDFSDCIINDFPAETRVLVISDCCHSGSIGDLAKDKWGDRHCMTISGCMDAQTSTDLGKGGVFTHSMLLGIDGLQHDGEETYSVGMLFNAMLDIGQKTFQAEQDFTIETTSAIDTDGMAFPLIPVERYRAPMSQAWDACGGVFDADALEEFGISKQLAGGLNPAAFGMGKLGHGVPTIDPKALHRVKKGCAVM